MFSWWCCHFIVSALPLKLAKNPPSAVLIKTSRILISYISVLVRYRSQKENGLIFPWIVFCSILHLRFFSNRTFSVYSKTAFLTTRTDKQEASHLTSLNRSARISIGVVTFILKQLCPLCVSLPMLSETEQMQFPVLFQHGLSSVPSLICAQRGKWKVL